MSVDAKKEAVVFKGIMRLGIVPFPGQHLGHGDQGLGHRMRAVGIGVVHVARCTGLIAHVLDLRANVRIRRDKGQAGVFIGCT